MPRDVLQDLEMRNRKQGVLEEEEVQRCRARGKSWPLPHGRILVPQLIKIKRIKMDGPDPLPQRFQRNTETRDGVPSWQNWQLGSLDGVPSWQDWQCLTEKAPTTIELPWVQSILISSHCGQQSGNLLHRAKTKSREEKDRQAVWSFAFSCDRAMPKNG